jgi:hypothetical protein
MDLIRVRAERQKRDKVCSFMVICFLLYYRARGPAVRLCILQPDFAATFNFEYFRYELWSSLAESSVYSTHYIIFSNPSLRIYLSLSLSFSHSFPSKNRRRRPGEDQNMYSFLYTP